MITISFIPHQQVLRADILFYLILLSSGNILIFVISFSLSVPYIYIFFFSFWTLFEIILSSSSLLNVSIVFLSLENLMKHEVNCVLLTNEVHFVNGN
jgi:hypothetical protein